MKTCNFCFHNENHPDIQALLGGLGEAIICNICIEKAVATIARWEADHVKFQPTLVKGASNGI